MRVDACCLRGVAPHPRRGLGVEPTRPPCSTFPEACSQRGATRREEPDPRGDAPSGFAREGAFSGWSRRSPCPSFLAGGPSSMIGSGANLGTINTSSLALTSIGGLPGWPELTGTLRRSGAGSPPCRSPGHRPGLRLVGPASPPARRCSGPRRARRSVDDVIRPRRWPSDMAHTSLHTRYFQASPSRNAPRPLR